MSEATMTKLSLKADLKVNGPRLVESIHSTCEIGKAHPYGSHYTETGMSRLALDDNDKRIRLWLVAEAKALGCTVTVDQMGNIFAIRPGKVANAPPVMMGSHLDTQPTGGRYDGILGVLSALEVLKTLVENAYETKGPVGLINWTNEEGARFPMVAVSSAVWAGSVPIETAWSCKETQPSVPNQDCQTLHQELKRIGFLGETLASHEAQPIAAHFELHIEQGPVLENEGQKIGVVIGAQAYSWFEVEIEGRDSHAGTTPLSARKDAVLAAAKMIVASNKIAKEFSGLVTTGIIQTKPGSMNTISNSTRFTLDIRHQSNDKLSHMVKRCKEAFEEISRDECELGVAVKWTTLVENTAAEFHPDCIAAVEAAAEQVCASHPSYAQGQKKGWRHMVSGAGHDSCNANIRAPTAMIFTPTRGGMSHCPDEYCSPEDCAMGAQVLLGAVLRYDASRELSA